LMIALQPIAFGVTIGRSPISFSNLVLQSQIVSNIQFLTFSILIVDFNSQKLQIYALFLQKLQIYLRIENLSKNPNLGLQHHPMHFK